MTVSEHIAQKESHKGVQKFINPFPKTAFVHLDELSGLSSGAVMEKLVTTFQNNPELKAVSVACSSPIGKTKRHFVDFTKVFKDFCNEHGLKDETQKRSASAFLRSFVHEENEHVLLLKAIAVREP